MEIQDRFLDLQYHSFASVWTKAASNTVDALTNPFDEDNYSSYSFDSSIR